LKEEDEKLMTAAGKTKNTGGELKRKKTTKKKAK